MHYGVQYYPEQWPRDRWPMDAALMQEAGVTLVRMGEFAWSAYEPQEGQVDFSWMEEAIDLLGQHGIQTLLCTCSRTPPPWAYHRYPGIANADAHGTPCPTDARYRVGLGHPEFVDLSRRIDEAVIRQFAGHEHIIGWQVDNEVGAANDCHCPRCREAFQVYLREKYGTIEALHEAWGAHFWSFTFTDFAEVPVPGAQPQLVLEYRRFMSGLNRDFTQWRTDRIRDLDPGKPVTTNFQSIFATHTDVRDLGRTIDINGMNHYPTRTPELALDATRGPRGTFWVLEQHTRLRDVDTPDGMMRLWAWMAMAHGADAVIHFRWRQSRWGWEQYCDGLLPHSGEPNRFYRELQRTGQDLQQVGDLLEGTRPAAQAAVAFHYESRWAVQASGLGPGFDPVREGVGYHEALARRIPAIDVVEPTDDLSRYTLVVAPRLWITTPEIAGNLSRFVEAGGTLVLTAGSGVADEGGCSFDHPRPGHLSELAGLTVSDLAHEDGITFSLASDTLPELKGGTARMVADELHPGTAEVLATHASGWRAGLPAITLNPYGAGRVLYVGVHLDPPAIAALVDWLCSTCEMEAAVPCPEGVRAYERSCEAYRLLFLLNFSGQSQNVGSFHQWTDAVTGHSAETVSIAPRDLAILRRDTPPSTG